MVTKEQRMDRFLIDHKDVIKTMNPSIDKWRIEFIKSINAGHTPNLSASLDANVRSVLSEFYALLLLKE